MLFVAPAWAYTDAQIANAIYKAEGGARYAYGINRKYCKYKNLAEARKICLNTIRHARRDFNGKGDFIIFLGLRYCPPGAAAENKFWVRNVKHFLK